MLIPTPQLTITFSLHLAHRTPFLLPFFCADFLLLFIRTNGSFLQRCYSTTDDDLNDGVVVKKGGQSGKSIRQLGRQPEFLALKHESWILGHSPTLYVVSP